MFDYLLLTSILTTGHAWVLTSTHTNIIPKLTEDVKLHCFYEGVVDASQTMDEISRIRLLKMDHKNVWNEYAEIIFLNTTVAEVIGPKEPGLSASGHLGKVDESFLSVTWSTSSEDTVGSYQCEIDGFAMDNGNDAHATTGMVNLTHNDVTTKELLDLVVQMRQKVDQLSQEINSLKVETLIQHQNLTKSIKSQVHSDIVQNYFELRHWPAGNYSLLSTDDGCPDTFSSKFQSGFSRFQTETSKIPRNNFTSAVNLRQDVFERCGLRNVFKLSFCAADIKEPRLLWPSGTYCISYAQAGCPKGFQYGYTDVYPETSRSIIGTYFLSSTHLSTSNRVRLRYCCRDDGHPEMPILLPNARSFYLYRFKGRCQKVQGSNVQEQVFTIQTDATKDNRFSNQFHADGTLTDFSVQICYYYKK